MATLEKLRNRAGTLVAVVIGLALLAFILGDLFGSGGSLFNRTQFEIAEISGKSIPYQLYQERIDHIVELNKAVSGQSSIDEQTAERIREEVWNEIVRESVLGKSYNSLGITITSEELFDMVQGNNLHPIIREQFGNRQTGEVDRAMIIQFLKNMENDPSGLQKTFWLYIENIIQKDRMFNKYNNLINKGMFVTDLQIERSLAERNKRVDFGYVLSQYKSIEDSIITVTQKEITKYHKENKHEFEQQASRDVEYVVFPIKPSQDDYKIAEEWIHGIKADFAQANDPIQFSNLNSDNPFNEQYQSPDDIENQELRSWAFTASVGEVFGPLFENDTYKLARLVEIANLPDSVKARHILLSIEGQSRDQLESTKEKADSLLQVLQKRGNFAQLATQYSDDPGSASQGGDLGWFPEGVMVKPFNDACFSGKKGDIFKVETQFGFHIIELLDIGKPSKKVQFALVERQVVPSTRTYQKIYQEASEFAGLNSSYEEFVQAAQEKKLSKRIASNLKESDRRVAGLENPREMVRWAYGAKEHSVSPVFEFGSNFVVAALKQAKEQGVAPVNQVKDDIKAKIIRDKKSDILIEKTNAAMAEASTIEDVANSLGLSVQEASRVSFASFSLPNVGFEPAVIGTAVSSPEGVMAGPIKGNSGVYALSVNAINIEEGDSDAEKRRLMTTMQSRAGREAYEAIKESAEIVDKRSRYF